MRISRVMACLALGALVVQLQCQGVSGNPFRADCEYDGDCRDSSVCSLDSCYRGQCLNMIPDDAEQPCCSDAECDDGDPCTDDFCDRADASNDESADTTCNNSPKTTPECNGGAGGDGGSSQGGAGGAGQGGGGGPATTGKAITTQQPAMGSLNGVSATTTEGKLAVSVDGLQGASSMTIVDPTQTATVQQTTLTDLRPKAIVGTTDGSFGIAGKTAAGVAAIARVSAAGVLLWGLELPFFTDATDIVYDAADDVLRAVLGCTPDYQFFVAKVTGDGVLDEVIEVATPVGSEAVDLAVLSGGTLAVAGIEPLGGMEQNALVTFVDASDITVATSRFANTGATGVVSVESTLTGAALLGRTRTGPSGPLDPFVALVADDGTVGWQMKYGTGGEIVAKNLVSTPTGLVLFGQRAGQMLWLRISETDGSILEIRVDDPLSGPFITSPGVLLPNGDLGVAAAEFDVPTLTFLFAKPDLQLGCDNPALGGSLPTTDIVAAAAGLTVTPIAAPATIGQTASNPKTFAVATSTQSTADICPMP